MPYFLAPLWDVELAAQRRAKEEQKMRLTRQRVRERNTGLLAGSSANKLQRKDKKSWKRPSAGVDVGNDEKGRDNSSDIKGTRDSIGAEKVAMPLDEGFGLVPRDLRRTLKRSKGAKGLLVELEEEVRRFVMGWEKRQQRKHDKEEQRSPPVTPTRVESREGESDSDEELVFVGRGGTMRDVPASPVTRKRVDSKAGEMEEVVSGVEGMEIDGGHHEGGEEERGMEMEKLVFGAPAGDKGATFG